jgi:hypothetical protein
MDVGEGGPFEEGCNYLNYKRTGLKRDAITVDAFFFTYVS